MSFLPISLQITDKTILFVGGGSVCVHKIAAVQQCTKNIRIVSIDFLPDVRNYGFPCIQKSYDASDLEGVFLVYACTNNPELHKQIVTDAHARGILVNVADNPGLCDFISPALYIDGNISIAVSSGGTNVKKAVAIRNKIREIFSTLY